MTKHAHVTPSCEYDPMWYDCDRGPRCSDCLWGACEGCGQLRVDCGCDEEPERCPDCGEAGPCRPERARVLRLVDAFNFMGGSEWIGGGMLRAAIENGDVELVQRP